MIYETTQLKKELRLSYAEQNRSKQYFLFLMAALALAAVSVHFMFLSARESALSSMYPYLSTGSALSVLSVLRIFANIFFTFWFILNYETVTFAEIGQNRWYLMRKMGFQPWKIASVKLLATIIIVLVIYSGAFMICLLFSAVFAYNFAAFFLIPVYAAGITDIMLTVAFVMLISLAVKDRKNAAPAIIVFAAVFAAVRMSADYPKFLAEISYKDSMMPLFANTVFMAEAALIIAVFIACGLLSVWLSRRTTAAPIDPIHYLRDFATGQYVKVQKKIGYSRFIYVCGKALLYIVLIAFFAAELFIIAISFRTQGSKLSAGRYTPFVIATNTMSGVLEKHDIALFERVGADAKLQTGDVIAYIEDREVKIRQITSIKGDDLHVDVRNYSHVAENETYAADIRREDVAARLILVSRFMGVIYLIMTSTVGKIVFLLVPLLVFSFYDSIAALLKQMKAANAGVDVR